MKNVLPLFSLLVSLLIACLFSLTVSAQSRLAIDGPTEAAPGSLVRLTAAIDDDESAWWIVVKPSDLDYEVVDSGKRILFASGCQIDREIVVVLLAQKIEGGRIATRQQRHSLTIGEPKEGEPNVPKKPSIERDWSEIAEWVQSQSIVQEDAVTARLWSVELDKAAEECRGKTIEEARKIVGQARRLVFVEQGGKSWNDFFQGFDRLVEAAPPRDVIEYIQLTKVLAKSLTSSISKTNNKQGRPAERSEIEQPSFGSPAPLRNFSNGALGNGIHFETVRIEQSPIIGIEAWPPAVVHCCSQGVCNSRPIIIHPPIRSNQR